MNELEHLLELATTEPAHGPAFFRALLSSDVFALISADDTATRGFAVRYVTWTGADGVRVVPFFASRGAVRRALTKKTRAVRLECREFLESCRGATVVLNPNENYTFRLAPDELDRLVSTGLPDAPEVYVSQADQQVAFRMPQAPPSFLDSLRLLLARHRGVQAAYLATMTSALETVAVWLIAIRSDHVDDAGRVATELSSTLAGAHLDHTVDLMRIDPGSTMDADFRREMLPFYERPAAPLGATESSDRLH